MRWRKAFSKSPNTTKFLTFLIQLLSPTTYQLQNSNTSPKFFFINFFTLSYILSYMGYPWITHHFNDPWVNSYITLIHINSSIFDPTHPFYNPKERFVKVARGSIVGGVRLGMFTAAFCGLQNLLAETRGGVHDVYNVVGAGSATAATFGLIMPGSLHWRVRNVMLGSVLGAAICFPLGWLQMKLVEKANEGNLSGSVAGDVSKSGLGNTIDRIKGNLNK